MARIVGVPKEKASWTVRFGYRYARKRLGKVPEPLTLVAHHGWLFQGNGAFELALQRSRKVDARLKGLASLKVATLIGCPF